MMKLKVGDRFITSVKPSIVQPFGGRRPYSKVLIVRVDGYSVTYQVREPGVLRVDEHTTHVASSDNIFSRGILSGNLIPEFAPVSKKLRELVDNLNKGDPSVIRSVIQRPKR